MTLIIWLLEKTDNNSKNELTYAKQLFLNNSTFKIVDLDWIKAYDTVFIIIRTYHQKAIALKL